MAATITVAQRAKKAAIISALTFGIGGWFWAGHWFYGLMMLGAQFLSLIMMFFMVGFFMFPMFWIGGTMGVYLQVKRVAMESFLLRQVDEAEVRNKLAGGAA